MAAQSVNIPEAAKLYTLNKENHIVCEVYLNKAFI